MTVLVSGSYKGILMGILAHSLYNVDITVNLSESILKVPTFQSIKAMLTLAEETYFIII